MFHDNTKSPKPNNMCNKYNVLRNTQMQFSFQCQKQIITKNTTSIIVVYIAGRDRQGYVAVDLHQALSTLSFEMGAETVVHNHGNASVQIRTYAIVTDLQNTNGI